MNLFDNKGTLQLIDGNVNFVENLTLLSTNAPCSCAGTMIATDGGDVAVEALATGDTVLTAGASLPLSAGLDAASSPADHALILANGMAAETFVDNVDRMGFENWAEHEALFGTDAAIAEKALPRAKSARQVPAATRARLLARRSGYSCRCITRHTRTARPASLGYQADCSCCSYIFGQRPDQVGQFLHWPGPVARGMLPKNGRCRIPGARLTGFGPAPIGVVSEQQHGRAPKRAGQMGHHRIDGDDERGSAGERRATDHVRIRVGRVEEGRVGRLGGSRSAL